MKTLKNTLTLLLILISTISNSQNISYDLLSDNTTEFKTGKVNYELNMYVPKTEQESFTKIKYSNDLTIHNHYGTSGELGVGLLIAGAAFIVGGLTTLTPYYGYDGSNKPFFKQGPRMVAILGGGLIFSTGIVITISQ